MLEIIFFSCFLGQVKSQYLPIQMARQCTERICQGAAFFGFKNVKRAHVSGSVI
jgi:hypothetical protein